MVQATAGSGLRLPLGYEFRGRLGQGSFGEVWDAVAGDGAPVALKILRCAQLPGGWIANEIRQLMNLRNLRHPHLIELYDVFATSKSIILSMERADGNLADLHQAYLEETGQGIPADHLCDLLTQAADALDFVSQRCSPDTGAVWQHCDVKPNNLLLIGECLKVADFGLSTRPRSAGAPGPLQGTVPYAAPEMQRGRLSNRIDQFALAVSYCLLRKGTVQDGESGLTPDLSPLSEVERAAVARGLSADPTQRWPSCRALMAAIRQALDAGRSPAGRRGWSERGAAKCR